MQEYSRLFDILYFQQKKFPKKDALNYKYDGEWRSFSTSECLDYINKASRAFLEIGLKSGDAVAIISANRPEWNFIDNGMMQVGIINVPIYPTISESDYKYIFNDAKVKIAFVEDEDLAEKMSHIKNDVPSLQHIFTFDTVPNQSNWEVFLEYGKKNEVQADVENIKADIKETDLATLIYTSGTTGIPKGVMLSHKNIVSNVEATLLCLPINENHRTISFLPLCHIFERMVIYTYFAAGSSIYYAENLEKVGENIKEVKPHFFSSVPRLLEKVYEKIMAKGYELSGIKKKLFFWSVGLGLEYEIGGKGSWYNFKLAIANKLIFNKWREALGGELIGIATGAAALQERLGRLFSAAGIKVREGYGQTETSPVLTFNRFDSDDDVRFGTVGVPIPGVEIKIGENNEILAKGPNIMMGYYDKPEETKATIDSDGWLHTGDCGVWVDNKFLKITGRVKALFKTSGGKYVAPEVIENKMVESEFIEQICVIGENRKFVSALIVPAFINLSEWCTKNAVSADNNDELINTPEVKKLYRDILDEMNKHFGQVEQVKKFKLITKEWSVESGELTPTMKVKRNVIMEKFSTDIEELYDNDLLS
ncbi:MAG: long-chain fatty acid--CoA ligase [Chitinophagales bacterium]|nr:long-chain fatty acid--CoA ligase [Chitinophagales bacterium]